jgi:hypothetical protein
MKKSPPYMMLSGWLPIPWSHWIHFQSLWVGSNGLTTDQFYVTLKIIADGLNDKHQTKKVIKDALFYLKSEKSDTKFTETFVEEGFVFVHECYKIEKYYYNLWRHDYTPF